MGRFVVGVAVVLVSLQNLSVAVAYLGLPVFLRVWKSGVLCDYSIFVVCVCVCNFPGVCVRT